MSDQPDHERVRQLLKRIDEITKESGKLRDQIDKIREVSPEWPDRRRRSRLFNEGNNLPKNVPPED